MLYTALGHPDALKLSILDHQDQDHTASIITGANATSLHRNEACCALQPV